MLGGLLVIGTINVLREARRVAAVSLETSPEKPASLHSINSKIAWNGSSALARFGLKGRSPKSTPAPVPEQAYLGLRDLKNASAQVVTTSAAIAGLNPSLSEGDRVVLLIKPEYWIAPGACNCVRKSGNSGGWSRRSTSQG